MRVEIITHCYAAGPNGAQYAKMLAWQLDSFRWAPPQAVDARFVVCFASDDEQASRVFWNASYRFPLGKIACIDLPREKILQRAIERHDVTRTTTADALWFTDCDYLFGPGCLDSLKQIIGRPEKLFFPRETLVSKDYQSGEKYLTRDPTDGIDPADFTPRRERKAIGGIQIVPGDVARKYGYCPNSKWQTPAPPECDTVIGFGADKAFRGSLGTAGTPIDIPNIYRIRHSTTGDSRGERLKISALTQEVHSPRTS